MSVSPSAARRALRGRLQAALFVAAARLVPAAAPALLPAPLWVAAGCTANPGGPGADAGLGAADAAPDAAEPPATPSPWAAEHPQPTGNALRAVFAAGSLAYAVGELGTVVRLSSGAPAVTEAEGLTRATLHAVTAVGEVVWAVGDAGTVLRRQGGTWSRRHLGAENLYTVFSDATGAVYAAGQGEALWRYDGAAWARSSLPGQSAADATYAGAAQGGLLLLGGSGGRILRGTGPGGSWQRESDGLTALPLRALLLGPDGSGFAVGDGGVVLRREHRPPAGPRWSLDLGVDNPPAVALRAVFASRGTFYAVTETGLTLHRGSTGWEPTGEVAVGRVSGGSGDDSGAFLAGDNGQIWRRGPQRGDLWQSALPVSTLTRSDITAIADAGDGSLYAASEDGLILRRALSGTWAVDGRAPLAQPLYALWAAGEEAYAVGSGGTLLQRQTVGNWQPVRYAYPEVQLSWRGVFAIGPSAPQREVLVVGAAVNKQGEQVAAVLHGVPAAGTWEPEPLDTLITEPLYAVAGNGSILLAVGSGGTVVRRDRGRWVREGAEIGAEVQLAALTVLGGAADADFYAAGTRGGLFFRDGKKAAPTWTRVTPPAVPGIGSLGGVSELTGELWVAGSSGFIAHRSAGGGWLAESTPTRANLRGLLSSGGRLFAAGQGGLILRRRDAAPRP